MKRPIVRWSDSIGPEVRPQMPNRFFRFAASDLQRAGSIATLSSSESLTDIGPDRLGRITHLSDVQQPTRRSINQTIDSIRRSISGVEYIEVAMWHDAKLGRRCTPSATRPTNASSFPSDDSRLSRAFWQSAPSGSPRPLAVRALWQSAPFGSPRPLAVRASAATH